MQEIINVLGEFGVSIAVIAAQMWYIVHKDKTHKEERDSYMHTVEQCTQAMSDLKATQEGLKTLLEAYHNEKP